MWYKKVVQFRSSVCCCPVFPTPFFEENVFFPLDILSCFVKGELTIWLWAHFWFFYSVPLIYMSVFVLPFCLDAYSFVVEAKVWDCDASGFGLLLQYYFGYLGPYKFRIVCSSFEKNAGAILTGIALNV